MTKRLVFLIPIVAFVVYLRVGFIDRFMAILEPKNVIHGEEDLKQLQQRSNACNLEIMEQVRRSANPQYSDFPCLDDQQFEPMSGIWEVEEYWELGLCMYSKARDKERVRYQRAVDVQRNRLRFGNIDTRPADTGGRAPVVHSYSIIWGSHGEGTASLHEFYSRAERGEEEPWAAISLRRGNHDRGMYRMDGDQLIIYWIVSYVSYNAQQIPLPETIPERPRNTWEKKVVLRRYSDGSIPVINFDSPLPTVVTDPEEIKAMYEQYQTLQEQWNGSPPSFEDRMKLAVPEQFRDGFDSHLQRFREP